MSSNKDKLAVLGKSYLLIKDIAVLLDIGRNQAAKVHNQFLIDHPNLWLNKIPTELFVKEFNINENRIIKYAQLEKGES